MLTVGGCVTWKLGLERGATRKKCTHKMEEDMYVSMSYNMYILYYIYYIYYMSSFNCVELFFLKTHAVGSKPCHWCVRPP